MIVQTRNQEFVFLELGKLDIHQKQKNEKPNRENFLVFPPRKG